jgi:hypothetical protein
MLRWLEGDKKISQPENRYATKTEKRKGR